MSGPCLGAPLPDVPLPGALLPGAPLLDADRRHRHSRPMSDLFSPNDAPKGGRRAAAPDSGYSAAHIEVLEGLEPVRRRPGMYIGGTDSGAYHHLASEIIDNAMDEAVAGHAKSITVRLEAGDWLTVRDDGRGIPVDPHPKFPKLTALEVILTTLHSGGKFSGKAYATSGGLHGVGSSVVNALSERLEVEVVRDGVRVAVAFERGVKAGALTREDAPRARRRGTQIRFRPDPQIFGPNEHWDPARLFRLCRSKAFLFKGVELRWHCDPDLIVSRGSAEIPAEAVLHFPGGLRDSLLDEMGAGPLVAELWAGEADLAGAQGRVEWALCWRESDESGFLHSFCNTVPTAQGGTHEAGLRAALLKGLALVGRASRQQAGGRDRGRGCDRVAGRQALAVHPRAAVPGPDQGETDQSRRRPA